MEALQELIRLFDLEFDNLWKKLQRQEPDKVLKVKKSFAKDISGRIYGFCMMNFPLTYNLIPPTVETVLNYVFHYHYFQTVNMSDEERATLQKDEKYKESVREAIKSTLKKEATGLQYRSLASKYSPEIYTCDFLCDIFLNRLIPLQNSLPEHIQNDNRECLRFETIRQLLENSFGLLKSVLQQLTYSLPAQTIIAWRALFELEYILLVLTRYDAVLAYNYKEFGKFSNLDEDSDEKLKDRFQQYADTFNNGKKDISFKNYGWILTINGDNLTPSLKTLLKLADQEERYQAYKDASSFVHTNSISLNIDGHRLYVFLIKQIFNTLQNLENVFFTFMEDYKLALNDEWKDDYNKTSCKYIETINCFLSHHN